MNTKTDLRVQKTHKALYETFMLLLEEKKFEEITVQELCDRAMVRRATFYKHFADKYDFFALFVRQFQELMLLQYTQKSDENSSSDTDNYHLFLFQRSLDFFSRHRDMVNSIVESSAFSTLLDILSEEIQRNILLYLTDKTETPPSPALSSHILACFYAGGIIQTLRYWITNQESISQEKIYEEFKKVTTPLR